MAAVTLRWLQKDAATAERVLQVRPGTSLMHAAVDAGIDGIAADCGGSLTCATCHVYVQEPWLERLPAPSEDEDAMLDLTASARQPNSRLSCQLVITDALDGLSVELPPSQY